MNHHPRESDYLRAVELLRAGDLVAFPTETVYGLGADAAHPAAVARIFAAKGRPADHPLIVHLPGSDAVAHWAEAVPDAAWALMEAFWPGPLTLILKKRAWVPEAVTGGQNTVGLRVPGHPVALGLLRRFGGGVAAPSANRFGRISPTTAAHVAAEMGTRVPLILDGGACAVGIESTIVDCSGNTPLILRPGHVAASELATVLGFEPGMGGRNAPRVPGALAAHYAPSTPFFILAGKEIDHFLASADAPLAVLGCRPPPENTRHLWRHLPNDPSAYARQLYAALREADGLGASKIIAEAPPDTPAWAAVMDRLTRASRGSGE